VCPLSVCQPCELVCRCSPSSARCQTESWQPSASQPDVSAAAVAGSSPCPDPPSWKASSHVVRPAWFMPTRHARAVRNERLAQPRDAVIGAVLFGQPRLPKAPAAIAAVARKFDHFERVFRDECRTWQSPSKIIGEPETHRATCHCTQREVESSRVLGKGQRGRRKS
jgi:hypothetical protein